MPITRKKKPAKRQAKPTYALVLRTCDANMRSYNGFTWPKAGRVKCDDWSPVAACGNGLHGLLWGEGAGELLNWDDDAKWLVVRARADQCVDLGGKVKFPAGTVVFCGDRVSATRYLYDNGGAGKTIEIGRAHV